MNRDDMTEGMLVESNGVRYRITQAAVPERPGYVPTDSFELVRVTPPEPWQRAGIYASEYTVVTDGRREEPHG